MEYVRIPGPSAVTTHISVTLHSIRPNIVRDQHGIRHTADSDTRHSLTHSLAQTKDDGSSRTQPDRPEAGRPRACAHRTAGASGWADGARRAHSDIHRRVTAM